MNIITPSFKIIEQKPGIQGIYEQIELAGRTCYQSSHTIKYDDNGNSTTAKGFVDRMVNSKHLAMCEHGTVYLKFSTKVDDFGREVCTWFPKGNYLNNQYSKVVSVREELEPVTGLQKEFCDKMYITHYYISTNLRVLVENDWLDDLQYLCEPTEYHEKRVTVIFNTDRITGESFLRHRTIAEDHPALEELVPQELDEELNSFARQSTRYCNYSKDKFSNEITITSNADISTEEAKNVLSQWIRSNEKWSAFYNMCDHIAYFQEEDQFDIIDTWLFSSLAAEWSYMKLLKLGWKPEQARRTLNFSINSPLVMTAFVSNWTHFLNLRAKDSTGPAHPDAGLLAKPLLEEFIKRGYIND